MFSNLFRRYLIQTTVRKSLYNHWKVEVGEVRTYVLYVCSADIYYVGLYLNVCKKHYSFMKKTSNIDTQQVILLRRIVRTPLYSHVKSNSRRGIDPSFYFCSEGIYYRTLYVNVYTSA